ncbi:hypothetical protein ABZX92_30265 [Lentzea sp. NPDC006480]|uniref:hypothetical protein n=1 Tax=Lentzea sp. NPDC006480 TaxID=3157176 RepID=UPI0033A4D451
MIGFAMLCFGVQTTNLWLEQLATWLDTLYCTPEYCLNVPQALTGCVLAAAPVAAYFWRKDVAAYLGLFLVGLMGMLLIATDQDSPLAYFWVLPAAFFVAALVFVPVTALLLRRSRARSA